MRSNPRRLLQYRRSGLVEQEHFGHVLLIDKTNVLNSFGNDSECHFFQRSCAKPLQASLIIDFNLAETFNLTPEEIAVCCASHIGGIEHITLVKSILSKIELDETSLLCGLSQPIGKTIDKENLSLLHNNCSGKHAMMLALCKATGADFSNYNDINHPIQKLIYSKIEELCEVKDDMDATKDGCSVPIFATTLQNMGKGYLNLFLDSKYEAIKNAFVKYPYLIGGEGRLDSEIIFAGKGNLIAKVGAGGLLVVVNLSKQQALVIKISDCDMKARAIVAIETLKNLQWLSEKDITGNNLNTLYDKSVKTNQNEVLGEAELTFNL